MYQKLLVEFSCNFHKILSLSLLSDYYLVFVTKVIALDILTSI